MLEISKETRRRIKAEARRDMAWISKADLLDILKYVAGEMKGLESDLARYEEKRCYLLNETRPRRRNRKSKSYH
jgi:hypothetical protein